MSRPLAPVGGHTMACTLSCLRRLSLSLTALILYRGYNFKFIAQPQPRPVRQECIDFEEKHMPIISQIWN